MKLLALAFMILVGCKTAEPQQGSQVLNRNNPIPDGAGCFQTRDPGQQRDCIWGLITGTAHADFDMDLPGPISDAPNVTFARKNTRTFVLAGEQLDRKKSIHGYGVVAKVVLKATSGHPYTGIFASGSDFGLARLSVAVKPRREPSQPHRPGKVDPIQAVRDAEHFVTRHGPFSNDFTPGMALKIYAPSTQPHVGRQHSVNMHVMYSLDGQGKDFDFFKNPFSNVLPKPMLAKTVAGSVLFNRGLKSIDAKHADAGHLTVEHFAAVNGDGSAVTNPNWPYKVVFLPAPGVNDLFRRMKEGLRDGSKQADFRKVLMASGFAAGTVLYHVYGRDFQGDPDGEKKVSRNPAGEGFAKIGELVLGSSFVMSHYSDRKLHFAHHTKRN